MFGRMTQVQCRLERAFFKACKEQRIKAAREKQAEQSKQPERERKERMSHLPSSSPLPGGEWQAREGVGTALFLCARIQQAGC
jgi:hypothetical protein